MENCVKVSKEVFAPIMELVRIGLFRDEKDALTGLIREQARNKIQYYDGKVRKLERKYRADFREFKKLLRAGRTKKYLRNGTTSYGGSAMKRRCDTGLRSRRGDLLGRAGEMMLWVSLRGFCRM